MFIYLLVNKQFIKYYLYYYISDNMGTPIGELLEKEEITLDSLSNKTLGVDGFNIIYQFLTTIRDLNF